MSATERILQDLPLPDPQSANPAPVARPWPKLREPAFHGLAGEVVRTIAPHTEADPAAMLFSFMAAFGNAVGSGPYVVADGARHAARLFVLIVGKSAKARKGTSWAQIGRVLGPADPEWWDARVLGGLSSGEGLISAVGDPVEKDGKEILKGATDKRLLVVESEFTRVLAAQAREGNVLSEVTRQAFDTGNLRTMTKVPQVATGAHISIIGHVTIAELQAKLTKTDQLNGYANRFIVVAVRRSQLLPEGGDLAECEVARLGAAAHAMLQKARTCGRLQRTPAATALWRDLYTQMDADQPGGLLESLTARAEAQTLRLSLAYALMDGAPAIDVPHLEAAWACWRYCRASAEYVFGEARGDPIQDKLLELLRGAGEGGLTYAEQSKGLGGHISRSEITAARKALLDCGSITEWTQPTGGRAATVNVIAAKDAEQAKEPARAAPLVHPQPPTRSTSLATGESPLSDDDVPPEFEED